ncbi:hypothetical protein FRB90_009132 [Tulasnella sp. 427]|nr:hypothetical protein FRB90_009132 [Tulasnella sp. 427]
MSAMPPDPQPFVPTADAIHGVRRQQTHPIPQAYALPRSMSSHTLTRPVVQAAGGPIPMLAIPRGVVSHASQPPTVPYPHPEHAAAIQMRLPPRPLGHGRSGSSAPMQPGFGHVPPPISIPVLTPTSKPVNQHPTEKDLPKAPATGGLGLFVREPLTPIQQPLPPNAPVIIPTIVPTSAPLNAPPPPAPINAVSNQHPRPRTTRRNTVSECQRLPTPEAVEHTEEAIHKAHVRLDALWEQEQEELRREMDDERRKYEAKLRATGQDPPKPRKKSKSPVPHLPHQSDSPVMNEHGIPSPPPSMSPPTKTQKPSASTHDERERWRHEIRQAMHDVDRKHEITKQDFARAMQAQEQERLMRENYLRHQARLQAEAQAYQQAQQQRRPQIEYEQHHSRHPLPPTRDAPYPVPPRAPMPFAPISSKESRRAGRSRRKAQRESGYASGGARSTDGRSASNQNWRSTRPKRYYGEGRTDLRDEGMDGDRFEEIDEAGWEDIESPGAQEARMVKAAWDLYESRWNQLTAVSPPKENSLRFVDIPWPSMEPLPTPTETRSPSNKLKTLPPSALQISSVLSQKSIGKFLLSPYHSEGKSGKTRLRAALLRFHPDKVRPWMNLIQESERNAVVMGVEIVVRCLNELAKSA